MRRGRSVPLLYGAAALVYAIDRATKVWAESALAGGRSIDLIPGAVRIGRAHV